MLEKDKLPPAPWLSLVFQKAVCVHACVCVRTHVHVCVLKVLVTENSETVLHLFFPKWTTGTFKTTVFPLPAPSPVTGEQWRENTCEVCLGGWAWHILTDISHA